MKPTIVLSIFIICACALTAYGCYLINQKAPIVIITHPTEYHFDVDQTGYDVYTEDMRLVGRLKYGDNPTLDSLINTDNQ